MTGVQTCALPISATSNSGIQQFQRTTSVAHCFMFKKWKEGKCMFKTWVLGHSNYLAQRRIYSINRCKPQTSSVPKSQQLQGAPSRFTFPVLQSKPKEFYPTKEWRFFPSLPRYKASRHHDLTNVAFKRLMGLNPAATITRS